MTPLGNSDDHGSRRPMDDSEVFVRAAVRAFISDQPAPFAPDDGSWIERAHRAGVLPIVLDTLHRSGHEAGGLDWPVMRAGSVARHQRTMWELRLAGEVLDAEGIPWAVLKGPLLRSVIYERGHVRDYADVDILVPPEQR